MPEPTSQHIPAYVKPCLQLNKCQLHHVIASSTHQPRDSTLIWLHFGLSYCSALNQIKNGIVTYQGHIWCPEKDVNNFGADQIMLVSLSRYGGLWSSLNGCCGGGRYRNCIYGDLKHAVGTDCISFWRVDVLTKSPCLSVAWSKKRAEKSWKLIWWHRETKIKFEEFELDREWAL